jgi:hypothetical protein
MSHRSSFIKKFAKQELLTVDVCAYCGLRGSHGLGPDNEPWHLDHVEPLALGGADCVANIVKACALCNRKKRTNQWQVLPNTRFADGSVLRRDGTRTDSIWWVYDAGWAYEIFDLRISSIYGNPTEIVFTKVKSK